MENNFLVVFMNDGKSGSAYVYHSKNQDALDCIYEEAVKFAKKFENKYNTTVAYVDKTFVEKYLIGNKLCTFVKVTV